MDIPVMKKISLIILFLVNATIAMACDGSSITLTSGPTAIGGGQYSVTISMCTTQGAGCVLGNTGNFYFGVMGTTFDYPSSDLSVTSPHTAAVYGQVQPGPALGYTDVIGYTNAVTWFAVNGGFGCSTICTSITLIFNGYPTSLTVLALEGADIPANGCQNETIVFPILPVELVRFEINCNQDGEAEIEWTTQTEINNDYFVVEKSYDAVTFFELTTVQGAGNSTVVNNYSVKDPNLSSDVAYYRLKQVDFDGTTEYHKIASTSCNPKDFTVDQLVLNNNSLSFNINTTEAEDIIIYFYDYRGRIISNKTEYIEAGNNAIKLNNLEISTGIYMLSIVGEKNTFATKLMNVRD